MLESISFDFQLMAKKKQHLEASGRPSYARDCKHESHLHWQRES